MAAGTSGEDAAHVAPQLGGGLTAGGRATASVAVLMAVWWVAETLPLAVTSLLPIVLLPLTGALELSATTMAYGNPLVLLFMGGFVLALAMQRWGLHRRIALLTIRLVGTRPTRMIGGFMLATGGLSMWVSNTATTVMMLPIGVSVLGLVALKLGSTEATTASPKVSGDEAPASAEEISEGPAPNLGTGLMLGIAYAASIGSLATIIGTPPNTFLAGYLEQTYAIDLGFGQWMVMALPLSLTFLVLGWLLLTRILYRPEVPMVLAIPAALAATCAFALPVATPPNAIVFGSGYVAIPQMVRAGVVLNVVGTVLIVVTAVFLAPLVFGF